MAFNSELTKFLKRKHSAVPSQYQRAGYTTGSDPREHVACVCHCLAVRPWINHFMALSVNFLICKMGCREQPAQPLAL